MVEPNAAPQQEPEPPAPHGDDAVPTDHGRQTLPDPGAAPHGAAQAASEDTAAGDGGAHQDPEPPSARPGDAARREGGGDLDVDARFAEIVTGLGDLSEVAKGTEAAEDALPYRTAPWVRPAGPRDQAATPELEALEDEQARFTPPEPTSFLSRDPLLNLAWGAVALVPLALFVCALVWQTVPAVALQVAGVVFAAGVGALLWRMPARRNPEDDDPGAVV